MAIVTAEHIRRALSCGRPGCECSKGGVKTHCPGPSHSNGDQHPSLGVSENGGKVLVRCYGGCEQAAVIVALQEQDLWPRKEHAPHRDGGPTRIVATYDYRDASGGLSFQVVRLEPKDFRQRRPASGGGWEWKAGDRAILYRLPELLAAGDDAIVFLVEGEKDCDNLHRIGLVATTNAGGAKKWSDGNSAWLAGRRVVIIQDNDPPGKQGERPAGEVDTERKLRALRPIALRVALLQLTGLPVKGDVSDWLDAGGTAEQLTALAEAALVAAPAFSEPTPLPDRTPVFPTEVLPPSLAALIRAASAAVGVPPEFIGLPLIVLAGAVIGNAWEIALKNRWKQGPNLYGAIVAEPGGKKTPALEIARRPIEQIQEALARTYREREANYKEEMALFERSPKNSRGVPPEPPKFPHVWTSDPTTEALADRLSGSKGMALIKDELVSWVRSMDIYHGGKGADRQHYLSMWSRSPIKIDRKGNPVPIIVMRPCLSVIGGIQPDMLPDLSEKSGNDGFVDRLLWVYPNLTDNVWTEADVDEAVTAAADRLFHHLYALAGAEMPDGDIVPRVARLDSVAKTVWRQWYDDHMAEIRSDTLPSSLNGPWSKFDGQLARITLILHVTQAVDERIEVPTLISEQTIRKACRLADFFKEHARMALYSVRMKRSDLDERLLRALADRGSCTTTQLYEALGRRIKADRLRGALEQLEEDVLVKSSPMPSGPNGGRPGRRWTLTDEESEARQQRSRAPRRMAR